MQFARATGGISGQSWLDVTVAGSTDGYDNLSALNTALGVTDSAVISG
ncbi:hypothetical protein [Pseudidiomarina halophila]